MTDLRNYQPRPDLLKDAVILVTGATGGIGRVAALTFAAYGATVVLHGRDVSAYLYLIGPDSRGEVGELVSCFLIQSGSGRDLPSPMPIQTMTAPASA